MFREMRRKKQILSNKENIEILEKGTSGVLALLGDNGYPYAVPISYVYDNSKIYFHSAKVGYKIDAMRKCSKAPFAWSLKTRYEFIYMKWEDKGLWLSVILNEDTGIVEVDSIDSWDYPKSTTIAKKTIKEIEKNISVYFAGIGYSAKFIVDDYIVSK